MANTEIIAVLKKIRSIKKEIQRKKEDVSHPAKVELQEIYMILDDFEDEIILGELEKKVQELEDAADNLNAVIKTAKEKSDDLDEIAEKIDNVTKIIVKLADFAGKAAEFLA